MATEISFYLDENMPVVIAEQLRRHGITAVTARDLNTLSDTDINQLARAMEMGYVICTQDSDYIQLAAMGIEHAGIIFGTATHVIGDWVKGLILFHAVYTSDDMQNRVEYL